MIPDDTSSQHGQHTFRFSLLPYGGSWSDGGVIELGQDVNVPVTCFPVKTGPLEHEGTRVELSPSNVVLSAIKLPEDGSPDELVVRVYEAAGRAVRCELRVKGALRAWQSDMQELRGAALD